MQQLQTGYSFIITVMIIKMSKYYSDTSKSGIINLNAKAIQHNTGMELEP